MSARNVGKLPIFDDCNVVGILTSGDLAKHFAYCWKLR